MIPVMTRYSRLRLMVALLTLAIATALLAS
jgi:hypothetical protein